METRVQRLEQRQRTARSTRRFRATVVSLALAALMAITALGASAAINDGPGNGNPAVNPSGHCPPGQNLTTSPGGLKKCE